MDKNELLEKAKKVLQTNDLGGWTRPAPDLYPHQWLWDSCFIAIGLAHYDPERAKEELRHLVKGQWKNGMLPHIIFSDAHWYHADHMLWQSHRSKDAPDEVQTSAITQPPMLAEATVKVADKLPKSERKSFLSEMFPALLAYHEWLYNERCPNDDGLIVLVHSWESGLDNTPPWMLETRKNSSLPLKALDKITLIEHVLTHVRQDTHNVPAEERLSASELYRLYNLLKQLRSKKYDNQRILTESKTLLIDLAFNSILVRANTYLKTIAKKLDRKLPAALEQNISRTAQSLERLWYDDQYYSRDLRTSQPIMEPTVATFLPLCTGAISKERAKQLVNLLDSPSFATSFRIPSVSIESTYFKPRCYWQGPVWINMNWLIIDGLKMYGYKEKANQLKRQTLELVSQNGMYEYFSPLDGKGAGAEPFSWTAALIIDLLKS